VKVVLDACVLYPTVLREILIGKSATTGPKGFKKGEITEVAIKVAPDGNWATKGAASKSYNSAGPG
jgi:hypothetical protein